MSSTNTRNALRIVPTKSAALAGAAPARRRMVHVVPAGHPRRRADDVEHNPAQTPVAHDARAPLMNDWPADKDAANSERGSALPVAYSKPWLLAALWGRLLGVPRK